MKLTNNEYIDDGYKDDNSQALNSNESVINKTEEEEEFIERLMPKNFFLKS